MLSNTLFSVLFAVCALFLSSVSADHGHLAAHQVAHVARDAYGYTVSTSTLSSTKTVYKTVTVKKTHKYSTSTEAKPTHKAHHNSTSIAPYAVHNTTTYAHATGTVSTTVVTVAPAAVGTGKTTSASAAATVSTNAAGRIGAWSGLAGVAVFVCALLL